MKVLVTNSQLNLLRENSSKEFNCEKCDHSWEIKKEDKHPYMCYKCGYDSKKKVINYEKLESFWKDYKKEEIEEKWSEKYKKSINCNNPKGFSQRAHCQGRKKRLKESSDDHSELEKFGYDLDKIKKGIKIMAKLSDTVGDNIPLDIKLYGYELRKLPWGPSVLNLYIDVDTKDGKVYKTISENWHDLGMLLLETFQMLGIRDEVHMYPMYDFKFNKRSLINITIL